MIYQKIFRSGNTHRVTLGYALMHALKAQTGDTLQFNHVRPGVVEVTNPAAEQRSRAKGKKK